MKSMAGIASYVLIVICLLVSEHETSSQSQHRLRSYQRGRAHNKKRLPKIIGRFRGPRAESSKKFGLDRRGGAENAPRLRVGYKHSICIDLCDRPLNQTQKPCIAHRVQADFSGAGPKEDQCNVTLRSEGGGNVIPVYTKIDSLGKDRAIVRWFEEQFERSQRQNLAHFEDIVIYHHPLVSFANGLIGICLRLPTYRTLNCTQFELGDKEINWFSTNIVRGHRDLSTRAIYNLPRGEGFLTYVNINKVSNDYFVPEWGKYLIKIGLDGNPKQFLDPDMGCHIEGEMSFTNIFEDDQGNYCLSTVCVKPSFYAIDERVELSWLCSVAPPKSATTQRFLTFHVLISTWPFHCAKCPRAFILKCSMEQHVNKKHNRPKPFRCDSCDTAFGCEKSLKKHIDCVHKKLKPYKYDSEQSIYRKARNIAGENYKRFRKKRCNTRPQIG
ncbi:unnamed protein product [Trichogramma brassicae]|uniref:C2H2-type domain-containing protein n=1 Tax=Trichogramma brassicae TaxID=86971 RepID=A0A6H5J464_9HYME|nr:unnamed protein product [Trichogramma brassicae]